MQFLRLELIVGFDSATLADLFFARGQGALGQNVRALHLPRPFKVIQRSVVPLELDR